MFKFLFITFVVLYILYKVSTYLFRKIINDVSQTSKSDKRKKNSILDNEGEYVDYEELD